MPRLSAGGHPPRQVSSTSRGPQRWEPLDGQTDGRTAVGTRPPWHGSYFTRKREPSAPSSSASRDGEPALLGTYFPPGARALSDLGSALAMETGRCLGLWGFFLLFLWFSARSVSAFFIGHQGESRRPPLCLDSRLRMGGGAFSQARGAEVSSAVGKASPVASAMPASGGAAPALCRCAERCRRTASQPLLVRH